MVVLVHERGDILTAFTDKSDDFAQTFVQHGTFGFVSGEPSAYTQPLYGFFLVPIYFVVRYSIGLERFAQNEAAAELTGELAGFSTELWREFLSPGVELEVLGTASVHMPAWVLGVFFAALVIGAVF